MADESKELIKKDLVRIIQLNEKMHYDDVSEVEKVHNLLLQKNILQSPLGKKYIQRLEQIVNNTNNSKCILCNNNLDNQTVICNTCLTKFGKLKKENVSRDAGQKASDKNLQEQSKEELKKMSQMTAEYAGRLAEKAGQKAKDFINQQTNETSKKGNKKISPKIKIAIGVVVAFIVLGAILDNVGAGNSRQTIDNGNQAYAVVQEFYSLEDFFISLNETASVPSAIFEGKVGKKVDQEAFTDEDQVGAYCFGVNSKDKKLSGQVWVSADGGVVQFGLEGDGNFYLIR